jgi:hypothetical protein
MSCGTMRGRLRKAGPRILAVVVLVALVVSVGIVPGGASYSVTRLIEPSSVSPGGRANVTLGFTTAHEEVFISLQDRVPLGWNVTNISVNAESANYTVNLSDDAFNASTGTVLFLWLGIAKDVPVQARYTLHVPPNATQGFYNLTGNLSGWNDETKGWNASVPRGNVSVTFYGVDIRADEGAKTTDPNVNATYYLTVKNTGANADTYTLSIKANDAPVAKLNKTVVALDVNKSAVVTLTVASPTPGQYTTTVRAESAHASANVTVTTTVRASTDTEAPVVSAPSAQPFTIPEDTDGAPLWGERANLSALVIDASNLSSVTINLSLIGGSAAQPMTRNGSSNLWNVLSNASIGSARWNGSAYQAHELRVNATDIYGYSNTSVTIPLMVLRNGDVNKDGAINFADVTYLANHAVHRSGYDAVEDTIAEVNGDGSVNFADVTYLANYAVHRSGYEKLK